MNFTIWLLLASEEKKKENVNKFKKIKIFKKRERQLNYLLLLLF